MVLEPISERKAIVREGRIVYFGLLLTLTVTFVLIIPLMMRPLPEKEFAVESMVVIEEVPIDNLPEEIDFQTIVDEWVNTVGGTKSIVIYDLERDEVAATYNAEQNYNTASLYKLFVVYEGYRRVNSGEWDKDASVGSTGYTVEKCLDLAIRESNSPCAETLWAWMGHGDLDDIIVNDYNITDSAISSLLSNATDITKMMKLYYEHPDITDAVLVAAMKDSMLNQPITTYNWRQGLPSGFSEAVNVYNKVGWLYNGRSWDIYHDAAIVEFPEQDRHFIVVVMTNNISFTKIRDLATRLENAV